MTSYTEKDLMKWEEKIKEIVDSFGLDPFPQIFEICDKDMMIGYMSYSGMPSRYPHWSFGKHFEKQSTMHKLGLAGLPYEMVINSNPSLAYLMQDNSLLLQILTMAHVYAHNDFFKNNLTFRNTAPEYTLESFKTNADRIRKYHENPNIGTGAVENVLDAAHALAYNCDRFGKMDLHREKKEEKEESKEFKPDISPYGFGYQANKGDQEEKSKKKFPIRPEKNILLFIRDHNPNLSEWQKDLLSIIHKETLYFLPQIETKIMNEGWASTWHKRILDKLELPEELRMEFFVRHNQVLQPIPGGINPYYVGYKMFENIEKRWNDPTDEEIKEYSRENNKGTEKIFQVRESDRDESFLRQYLTKDLMKEMHFFQHEQKGKDRVVTKVSTENDWQDIKQTMIANVGMNSYPVITIQDANYKGNRELYLVHEFDERELDQEYTSRTLKYIHQLWGAKVVLRTTRAGKRINLIVDGETEKLENVH